MNQLPLIKAVTNLTGLNQELKNSQSEPTVPEQYVSK